jgi:hypothetical protein
MTGLTVAKKALTMRRFQEPLISVVLALLSWPGSHAADDTAELAAASIVIADRAGAPHEPEVVSFGLPLPRGWRLLTRLLQLVDENNRSVPAQFDVLARWGAAPRDTEAPIKWVLVSCRQSLAAGGRHELSLRKAATRQAPPVGLTIDVTRKDRFTVNTGAATFVVNTDTRFNLIEQVLLEGQPVLEPLEPREAIAYQGIDGLSIVSEDQPDMTPRTSAVIERSGPLSAVVSVADSILDAHQRPVLDFTARLHFAAGRSDVRLDFTVENNHPVIAREDDNQPTNVHNLGSVNSVYIGDLLLRLRLRKGPGTLVVRTEQGTEIGRFRPATARSGLERHRRVERRRPGGLAVKNRRRPRLQYCSLPGRISGGGLDQVKIGQQRWAG